MLSTTASGFAQRRVAGLPDSWKFIKQDAALDAGFDSWESVAIPHTWNAFDGQDGKEAEPQYPAGYYRGPTWYARRLDVPADWKGRRIFLKFEAVSLVADVYLNGRHLGQHRGAFGAFVFELTGVARPGEGNILRVKVDNTRFEDVPPLAGDFTVFGGIYRPVSLFSTDEVCIDPLFFGSAGVFLTGKNITPERAEVEVGVRVSNGGPVNGEIKVEADLLDGDGTVVKTVETAAKVPVGKTDVVRQTVAIDKPLLWAGRTAPHLYSVRTRLLRRGKIVDEITQPLGLRTVRITDEQGFLLNDKPYALHGVNRHQEWKDKGWALSPEDDDADLKMIDELGATCVRLAHYPQNSHVHDIADHLGLVLWQEIPLVEQIRLTEPFDANALQQLQEMIYQGWNHPSLCLWGIYNELFLGVPKEKQIDAVTILTKLRDLAHGIDPSRPVVAATHAQDPLPIHRVPDWQAVNPYPGWYWTAMDKLTDDFTKAAASYGKQRTALSEYGAGANPKQHQEGLRGTPARSELGKNWNPGSQWHPEEYQTLFHIAQWKQVRNSPSLWGTFVWAMFDFASDKRNEGGQPGINDKGLVTHDRKLKKDAFYFYKANWNPEPMVYIAARRNTPRRVPNTEILVFANCGGVELKLNGTSLGQRQPDEVKVATWENVTLQSGINRIEAVASDGGSAYDVCDWLLE